MKAPRFTLQTLLVLVTLTAGGLWVWRAIYTPRSVTEVNVQTIEIGFTEWQVHRSLGPPHYILNKAGGLSWGYNLQGSGFEFVTIHFEDDQVSFVQQELFAPYWAEKSAP